MGAWVRLFTPILAFVAASLFIGVAGAQQLDPGNIEVVVTDVQSRSPVANAAVFLLGGDQPISSLTDERGRIEFESMMPGTYRVSVRHAGYQQYDSASFELDPHSRVTLAIAMMPSAQGGGSRRPSASSIKTIAQVTVHASASITEEDLNADSAERRISTSLSDALSKLAGVSIDNQIYGDDSGFNVSLNNHDASQTAVLVDGIHIPGAAGNIVGPAQNLFTGASVSFTPTAGYLGGSINYQTLMPTKFWAYHVRNEIGDYGAQLFSASATGSVGKLGVAAQHVFSARDSFLSGLTYEDQSGKTYLHTGGNASLADLAKFTYPLGKRTSLRLSAMTAGTSDDPICANYTTLLPCGYGPGSFTGNNFRQGTFAVNSLIGNVDALASLYAVSGRSSYDYPQRYLNGVPSPYFSHTAFYGGGAFAQASITAKRHTDALRAQFSRSGSVLTRPINGAVLRFAQPVERTSNFGFSDSVKASPNLDFTHGISLQSGTDAGSALVLEESVNWNASKNDRLEGSLSAGSAEPAYQLQQYPISDVLAADYDCYNGSVFVDGPSDPAVRQSSVSYNLAWRHIFNDGNVTVNAYRQNAYGQQFFASLPILGEPNGLFADGLSGFLQQLQNAWSSPAACGNIPFDPQHVYVSKNVSGLGQVYQGVTLSGRIDMGRNVVALPTFALGSTYLTALDPRMEVNGSYYAAGRQLPHRPLQTAGITFDGVLPKSHLEWLANAQFTSVNNRYDLPAFTVYSAGLVFHTNYGSLTLLDANVFGTRPGLFSTYQDVSPVPTVGGGSFAFASEPLPPREWQVTWDIPWRQHTTRKH